LAGHIVATGATVRLEATVRSGKSIYAGFASLFAAFQNLLVSEDFANTAKTPTTIFDPVHKNSNHILLLPGSQKYFFVSQSDADQIKNMVAKGQLPGCVLLASSGNLEAGEAGVYESFSTDVRNEAIWIARFFKGDIDFLESNEDLSKRMLNKMFTRSNKSLEVFKDSLQKFILLRSTGKMSDAINRYKNSMLPLWQPEKPAPTGAQPPDARPVAAAGIQHPPRADLSKPLGSGVPPRTRR
jgi:hypothetical protein